MLVTIALLVAACAPETDEVPADPAEDPQEQPEDAETFHLRFADFLGPEAAQIQAMQWWAEQVEERTDGRVTVEFFHGGSLLDATDTLPGIGDGRAELGHVSHFYHPDELPLSAVSELPFFVNNPQVQTRTLNELYETNEDFRAEWEAMGVHVLHFNPSGVIIIGGSQPLAGPDDLAGLQIRAVGHAAQALDAVGANPIAMPAPEIYESLQRGAIDTYSSFPFEVITAFQLQEVAPYVVDPGLGNYLMTAAPITKEVWDSMPQDIRDILEEVSRELLDGPVWDIYSQVEEDVCDAILDAGGEISRFSDDDVSEWENAVRDDLTAEWLQEVEGRGLDGEAFLDQYEDALERNAADVTFEPGIWVCADR